MFNILKFLSKYFPIHSIFSWTHFCVFSTQNMVQMSKQMKARHHTRRPPRRVGLSCYGVHSGGINPQAFWGATGHPSVSASQPCWSLGGSLLQKPSKLTNWTVASFMFSISTSSSKHPFFIYSMFFAADDMICSCGGIQCSHTDRGKKKQSFYMMISLCLQQHHIPMFHDYIPIVFHCYPKLFPQPPTTPLLLDPELRPWQIWRACVAMVIIYTYHNLYQNLYQNLYHVCITCI